MARRRHIVVNPVLGWIQGDLVAHTPAEAVAVMGAALTVHGTNAHWDVHVAPVGFPPMDAPYRGDDATLLDAIRATPCTRVPNARALRSAA